MVDLSPPALLKPEALLRMLLTTLSSSQPASLRALRQRHEVVSLSFSDCLFKQPVRFSCPIYQDLP